MAVYTHVSAEQMAALLALYDVGELISAKGIAEGVENTNYLLETTHSRYFLTLYEKRVNKDDLPFFLNLLDHVANKGNHVPRAIVARDGSQLQIVADRPACLIEFLTGVSVSQPSPAQAHAVGAALGDLHAALSDFSPTRQNTLGPQGWFNLADKIGNDFNRIDENLGIRVTQECTFLKQKWPTDLPNAVVHGDLFPDNVLMIGDDVTGLIDFYFACTEVRAWDLAVTHAAWCFDPDGKTFYPALGEALIAGYQNRFGLLPAEVDAFPILARGACLRFLLTRAYDWLNTPADALVSRKDPIAFLNRLDHYAAL